MVLSRIDSRADLVSMVTFRMRATGVAVLEAVSRRGAGRLSERP